MDYPFRKWVNYVKELGKLLHRYHSTHISANYYYNINVISHTSSTQILPTGCPIFTFLSSFVATRCFTNPKPFFLLHSVENHKKFHQTCTLHINILLKKCKRNRLAYINQYHMLVLKNLYLIS